MRWNKTCVLVAKTYAPDDEGVMRATDVKTEVFCNEFSLGAHTWSSMYEIGISADAEIQVRACDYEGQRDVVLDGKQYSVETVTGAGDFKNLVLRRQQSDSEGDDEQGQEDGDGD